MDERSIRLPSRLDVACLTQLHSDLLASRGCDLNLDASDVERIGGLGAQLLHSAFRTWSDDGRRLRLVDVAAELLPSLNRMGFPPSALSSDQQA